MIDNEFIWDTEVLQEYIDWIVKKKNKEVFKRINELLRDIKNNGVLNGKGKPERLKYYKKRAVYSRRITEEHRLVYDVKDGRVRILSCEGHYKDKNLGDDE